MRTNEMTEQLKYGETAECIKGDFEGFTATKNHKGFVFLVEEDIAYDFWDTRFINCEWSLNKEETK